MRARVAGTITFNKNQIPAKVLERLRRTLSLPNPEYVRRQRMKRYLGNVDERIECLKEWPDREVEIPRGAVEHLRSELSKAGIPLVFEDHRTCHPRYGFIADVALRAYQEEAVRAMQTGVQGSIVAPCGSGKTVLACAAIAAIDQPTLVIVHTKDLLDQWRDAVRRILKIEPGVVGQGRDEPGPITIATVQTLVRHTSLEQLGDLFGCVIVDECHHVPVSTFQTVLAELPARYRFGLTATPFREDGLTALIDWSFGDRLFEIAHDDLIAERFLVRPEVQVVTTGFSYTDEPYDHNACMTRLVSDADRNDLIAELAETSAHQSHSTLVLSNRIAHCRHLAQLIWDRGVSAEALVGPMGVRERSAVLDRFKTGQTRVLVATTLADEGLDVKRLSRVILAFPCRARGRTVQRLGRLMRPCPGKQGATLIDIVDDEVPQLLRQHVARRRHYRTLGIEPVAADRIDGANRLNEYRSAP